MEDSEVAELRQLSQRVCASVAAYVGAQLSGACAMLYPPHCVPVHTRVVLVLAMLKRYL